MPENKGSSDSGEEKFYREYLRLVGEKGEEAVEETLAAMRKMYGDVPLVARVLSEEKDYFLSSIIKNRGILHRENGPLDEKTMELVVISAATALRCDHCLEVHIRQAVKVGATKEEILQTILAACAIMENSGRATAFRKYRQIFNGREKQMDEGGEPGQ
ncbi:MAG: carboxymuconolactone decarboxylase family protein [Nitrospinota bacterium]|nr:carboxymuconolactone decarboxylase family protein [Nitrospinota bacterium]